MLPVHVVICPASQKKDNKNKRRGEIPQIKPELKKDKSYYMNFKLILCRVIKAYNSYLNVKSSCNVCLIS